MLESVKQISCRPHPAQPAHRGRHRVQRSAWWLFRSQADLMIGPSVTEVAASAAPIRVAQRRAYREIEVAAEPRLIAIRTGRRSRLYAFGLVLVLLSLVHLRATANTVPVGLVSWDVTQANITGQFDVANETGPNSSFDATFPVLTPVHLLNLVLSIQFNDATVRQFGMSDLTLNPFDGLSFESPALAIGGSNPKPVSASLTGQFASTSLTLFDQTNLDIDPTFSSAISAADSPLSDGDYALILANVASTGPIPPTPPTTAAAPEPAGWILVLTGAFLLALYARKITPKRT